MESVSISISFVLKSGWQFVKSSFVDSRFYPLLGPVADFMEQSLCKHFQSIAGESES